MSTFTDKLAAAKKDLAETAPYAGWLTTNKMSASEHIWDVSGSVEISESISEFMKLAANALQVGGSIHVAPRNPHTTGRSMPGVVRTEEHFLAPRHAQPGIRTGIPVRFIPLVWHHEFVDGSYANNPYYILEDRRVACAALDFPRAIEEFNEAMVQFIMAKGL